jgi:sugar phosphate isomerase/epimerase
VKLALTPDTRWDIEFAELIPVVGASGFTALGCPAGQATEQTRQAFGDAGLQCHELMALLITADAERTLAFAERLATAAATMSIPWVNTVFVAPPTPEVAKVITRCAAIFEDAGTAMAVEFSPTGQVPGIAEGLEVMDLAGHGARLLVDTWHFALGPSSWEDLAALRGDQIAYLQFTDAAAPISADLMDETMNRRPLPGDGIADVARFVDLVRGNGFDGYVSVEVLNEELRSRPVSEAVTAVFDAAARYWR